ncbi:Methyltransferase type 12, partial [mine drainage metagenome]
VDALLVELDPGLAALARASAARLPVGRVRVVEADAGATDSFAGGVPAEIVLACGVFDNVTDADVERTVRHLPEACAPAATIVWTRGRFAPDLTPRIRDWFRASGFEEVEFVPIPHSTAAVGVHRLARPPDPFRPGEQWFSFLPFDERPSNRHRAARSVPTGEGGGPAARASPGATTRGPTGPRS